MKKTLWIGCLATLLVLLAVHGQGASQQSARSGEPGVARVGRLIDQYCVSCHTKTNPNGIALDQLDPARVGAEAERWERVVRRLRAGVMPPPGARRPSLAQYEGVRDWLEAEIDRQAALNPGTTIVRRLNRTEYANAIRDLLDLEIDASTLLPPDDSARGFDNIASSLTISPALLDSYVTAATRVARMAVGSWRTPTETKYVAPADASQNMQIEGLPFGTRGGMMVRHTFPADGAYTFEVQNRGVGSFIPGEKLEISVDGERVHLFDYRGVGLSRGVQEDDGKLEVTVPVRAGTRTVGATFLAATAYRPSLSLIRQYARKSLENNSIEQLQYPPLIAFLRIQGPFGPTRPEDSRSLRKILTCRPASASQEEACARQVVSALARRAFRRPTTPEDLESLMGYYEEGRKQGTFEDGIELALRRILASLRFLVRTEREPADVADGHTYRITDLELASRLSFFLWSSIPDDELIDLASHDRLSDRAVLEQQVRRMLADPRSAALVEHFAAQFLSLRDLATTSPASVFYPDWDDELRTSFQRETELLVDSIMREDRNVVDLLTADYTFVNERLAKHYGIPHVYGSRFRRVTLGPELDDRRGLLGKGSFQSTTWAENFRTSPVKRGVWVLENILGTPPPGPPPAVPPLEDTEGGPERLLSSRERMTLHRTSQPCAGCHALIDNIGFALENFDADGQWRTTERIVSGEDRSGSGSVIADVPLDVAVELYDGRKVRGPSELRQALLRYSPQFVRTFTEKLMTHALRRGVEYFDMPAIRSIVRDAEKSSNRFSSLVLGIVRSPAFQMRKKSAEPAGD